MRKTKRSLESTSLSSDLLDKLVKKPTNYVMYGFNKDDTEDVGYLGKNLKEDGKVSIVQDIHEAKLFPEVQDGKSGSPEQWLDFWNSDEDNHFKFHLVKTTL